MRDIKEKEIDGEAHVKVHWIGFSQKADSWIKKSSIVNIEQRVKKNFQNRLTSDIQQNIKAMLKSKQCGISRVTISIKCDDKEFRRTMASCTDIKQKKRGKMMYQPSNQELAGLLGDASEWAYRVINAQGDYFYVRPGSVIFYQEKVRAEHEYKWVDSDFVKTIKKSDEKRLKICFLKKAGNSTDFSTSPWF